MVTRSQNQHGLYLYDTRLASLTPLTKNSEFQRLAPQFINALVSLNFILAIKVPAGPSMMAPLVGSTSEAAQLNT